MQCMCKKNKLIEDKNGWTISIFLKLYADKQDAKIRDTYGWKGA